MASEQEAFQGKVVVVTGASSGIGREALLGFARQGASVVAVGRDEAALGHTVAEAAALGAAAHAVAVDVTSSDGPQQVVDETVARFAGLDVLVNAAGVIASASIDGTSDELWDRLMDINARAPFRLMRAAFPHLKARGGNVVNVSSVNGLRSFPGVTAYCVSKAAVDHLTRCSALDWAPHGVRVNSVNPGVTITNLHKRGGMDEARYAEFLERAKTTHPLGRPGQPRDIAAMILFLASEQAAWMTGETIAVDGGRHLTCAR